MGVWQIYSLIRGIDLWNWKGHLRASLSNPFTLWVPDDLIQAIQLVRIVRVGERDRLTLFSSRSHSVFHRAWPFKKASRPLTLLYTQVEKPPLNE